MTDLLWRFDRDYRPEPECWEVKQVGEPKPETRNPAIGLRLNGLRDRRHPSAYQICLAMHIIEASSQR